MVDWVAEYGGQRDNAVLHPDVARSMPPFLATFRPFRPLSFSLRLAVRDALAQLRGRTFGVLRMQVDFAPFCYFDYNAMQIRPLNRTTLIPNYDNIGSI